MKHTIHIAKCLPVMRSLVTALLVLLMAQAAQSYDVNKDIRNLGPPAHDFTVILSGSETVTSHYDGYSSGRFGSFATGPVGPNTAMRWDNFRDFDNNVIDTGQTFHIGWSTADHSSAVKDMYFTDATGRRIPGSVVYNITSGWRYETASGTLWLTWENVFHPEEGQPGTITIRNVHVAVLRNPVPLEELNRENRLLADRLQPLPGGEEFPVLPTELVALQLQGIHPLDTIVVRYDVVTPEGLVQATDFVQFTVPPPTYDVNKDIRNLGPPAHDLTVILSGSEMVTNHYDGYPDGRFGSFATGPVGPNTGMRWDNFRDNDNNIIDPGQTIHIGWSTADHSSHVKDMYWTDATGKRIPGSVVYNITTGWRYETAREALRLSWRNTIAPGEGRPRPVQISNVQVGIFPGPWPLEELNRENRWLEQFLQPLPGGEMFVVEPEQQVDLLMPLPPPGAAVVLRYVVEEAPSGLAPQQGSAVSVDYVQFVARPPSIIGVISLLDFVGNPAQVPVPVQLRSEAGVTEVILSPDETGYYEIEDVPPGTYDISFKPSHWLRRTLPAVQVPGDWPAEVNVELQNGDIDGDNEVTLFDFGALVAAFGSIPGDPNWNPDADLDGDEEVTLFDFGVLVRNFGAIGDE
ncbi:hypothetical protein HRbin16_00542 [bacterium HR16]|nr:hypothetical protein HRbin16_00542 [bacterium HR16]